MKQTSRIKHSSRRHRLLAALSACGFAACLVSSQYAQAAPQATELQVEEGEVNPDAIVSSWVVKHIVGELMKKLVAYPFGKTNIPFSAKHFVPTPPPQSGSAVARSA